MEEHYVLSPPDVVERVSSTGRARLDPPGGCPFGERTLWAAPGAGRTAAAAALLADATGDASERLTVAFTTDVLDHLRGASEPVVIALAEVRAWRDEREPEVAQHWPPWRDTLLLEALAETERGGPRSDWLAVYRTIHGAPRI